MGVAKTLWDLLDYRRVSENIVDTRDPGTGDHFAGPRPLRWRVGVSAALVLGAGILVIVVGSEFFRSLPSAPEPLPMPTVPAEPSATTPELKVLVHVVGAVEEPGVVSLPENSRVHDALALAGGAREDAELGGVNLARIVYDGEQIIVPRIGDPALDPPVWVPGPSVFLGQIRRLWRLCLVSDLRLLLPGLAIWSQR